jgi:F-type H+-transporting ATPase subunit gamma
METIESLRRKIETVEELQSVVKTMKTIAAVSIRQYERAVQSLSEYDRTVTMGLQVVLRKRSRVPQAPFTSAGRKVAAVILGSEQGMCGQFNEQMAAFALDKLSRAAGRPEDLAVIAVGGRVAARLEEAGQPIAQQFDLPGSAAGITPRVQELLVKLEEMQDKGLVDRLLVFHHEPVHRAAYQPQERRLLPLDPAWLTELARARWPSRVLPTYTMEEDRLFFLLLGHYLFVSLFRAFAASLAAENASRLAAMQAAESHIEDRLGELKLQFNDLRQNTITEELLDIMVGFEAATGKKY